MTKAKTKKGNRGMRRAFVSLPSGIWDILDRDFKESLGMGDSEVIRTIVINYLSEKGYFVNEKGINTMEDVNTRIESLANMVIALTEELEENGDITQSALENRIRKKLERSAVRR